MSLDVMTLALAKSYADQHSGDGGSVGNITAMNVTYTNPNESWANAKQALDGLTDYAIDHDGAIDDLAQTAHSHKNKAVIDGITGQVTIDKLKAPDHATDLVQYGAFQIAAQQIISQIPTVPDVLPNPNALTIKIGSTTVTYDGSTAQTVEIADGTEVSY